MPDDTKQQTFGSLLKLRFQACSIRPVEGKDVVRQCCQLVAQQKRISVEFGWLYDIGMTFSDLRQKKKSLGFYSQAFVIIELFVGSGERI